MKCQSCHRTVAKKNKFCVHCGSPVTPRRSENTEPSGFRMHPGYGAVLLVAGLLLGYVMFGRNKENPGQVEHSHPVAAPATIDEIVKDFKCFCGQCEDMLAVCTCEHKHGAVEVRAFVAQKLAEGHLAPHIREMVLSTYGSGPALDDLGATFPGGLPALKELQSK